MTCAVYVALLSSLFSDPQAMTNAASPVYGEDNVILQYRVLDIPTPRCTTYDASFFGVDLPKDVPSAIQERAYTSAIWYTPE